MRILPFLLLAPLLLGGCSSAPAPPKVEAKPAPSTKKQDKPRTDHLLEDVKDAPTYGEGMLRTYQGAQEVKKQIDKQTAEQKDIQKDAD
jgi:PBP1b-binding outer membrane lipoprotein LpoB